MHGGIMATKQEAVSFLKNKLNAEETSQDFFKMLVEYGDNRSQVVFAVVSEEIIAFKSPFASVDDLSAKQALSAASEGVFGLSEIAGLYCLSHVAFVEDLDASEVYKSVGVLASIADGLEQQMVGGDNF
jgi:hypothetical protein